MIDGDGVSWLMRGDCGDCDGCDVVGGCDVFDDCRVMVVKVEYCDG